MAKRLQAMGQTKYRNGFALTLHEETLDHPLSWQTPRLVFVDSMSDLFHKDVPQAFIERTFDVMNRATTHTFQVLTKRARRLSQLDTVLYWPQNVWMGVTVENAETLWRIENLRSTKARVKFLSLEPLLSPLGTLDLSGIDWVIVGGESGPGARPLREDWVTDIRDQCVAAGVPFFFKQWGGFYRKRNGRLLDGRTWDEMPGTIRAPADVDPIRVGQFG
jgi:protein gp37